jgi:Mor family transcriptional regulator
VKGRDYEGRGIVNDMIEGCGTVVDRAVAVTAIREVCRYFGGQLVYIPAGKTTGETTEELRGVLRDAAGDPDGDRMLAKLMALYGGYQIYIPREERAFRRLIAREVYEKYTGTRASRAALCREYHTTYNTVYALYRAGRDEKAQMKFPFAEDEDG